MARLLTSATHGSTSPPMRAAAASIVSRLRAAMETLRALIGQRLRYCIPEPLARRRDHRDLAFQSKIHKRQCSVRSSAFRETAAV